MLTQERCVFPHEYYLVMRLYLSERVLGQYQNVQARVSCALNVYIGAYSGATRSITTCGPVPACFLVIQLFIHRK